jgi:hypothetical protein
MLRYMILCLVVSSLTACAGDIVMRDPRTGQTRICPGNPAGVDPWSQNYACAAGLAAQGWLQTNDPLVAPGL